MELASFILDKIKEGKTSLGKNEAFPSEEEFSFQEEILQERFDDIVVHLQELKDIQSLDEQSLINQLSQYSTLCNEIETKFKETLENMCLNYAMEFFDVPKDYVTVKCELVEKIKPQYDLPVSPIGKSNREFELDSVEESDMINKVIKKRRLINSLIQGASYEAMLSFITNSNKLANKYINEILKLDKRLPLLWGRIVAINDFLLFTKEEEITDKKHMQASYVAVHLGKVGETTTIESQALNFPYLLMDTLRGFCELFASHGLPKDNEKANYILQQADFLIAEPWDLRFGVTLFDRLSFNGWNPKDFPYIFRNICELPVDEFNQNLKEVFVGTRLGKEFIEDITDASREERLTSNINKGDVECDDEYDFADIRLNDSYSAAEEDYVIEEDSVDESLTDTLKTINFSKLYNTKDGVTFKARRLHWEDDYSNESYAYAFIITQNDDIIFSRAGYTHNEIRDEYPELKRGDIDYVEGRLWHYFDEEYNEKTDDYIPLGEYFVVVFGTNDWMNCRNFDQMQEDARFVLENFLGTNIDYSKVILATRYANYSFDGIVLQDSREEWHYDDENYKREMDDIFNDPIFNDEYTQEDMDKDEQLHLMDIEKKRNVQQFKDFRGNRDDEFQKKIGKLTPAQYHYYMYSESKKNKKKKLTE